MVGLHVIDNNVVDGAIADYFAQILHELHKEIYFHRVD